MTLAKNDRAIARIQIWLNGVTSTAVILNLDGYSGYNFLDSYGSVHWNLVAWDAVTDEKTNIISGVTPLDENTVENWGSSDQIVFDYVAQQLNLTLVP